MWTIFKAFIEFVTILLLLYVLVFWTGDMWDLATDQGSNQQSLHWKQKSNHSTTREVPWLLHF